MAKIKKTSKWYGTEAVEDEFEVDVEPFTYKESPKDVGGELRQRPKKVSGHVWSAGGTSAHTLRALSELSPIGIQDAANPTYSIGGHLIAVQLTGVDVPENICPVSKQTNDKMEVVEREIAKLAVQPLFLEVSVVSYWDDKDPRIPKQFKYVLKSRDKATLVKEWPPLDQEWLSPLTYEIPQGIAAGFAEIYKLCTSSKWAIENIANTPVGGRDLTFLKGHLPPLEKRRYAFLDYWFVELKGGGFTPPIVSESEVLDYIRSIGIKHGGKRTNFPEVARRWAKYGCIITHNNRLLSDVYGAKDAAMKVGDTVLIEPHQVLIDGGGYDAPQIDHILPDNQGGATCFSNAQVTSMQYNTTKQDATERVELKSADWKKQNLEEMMKDPKLAPHLTKMELN